MNLYPINTLVRKITEASVLGPHQLLEKLGYKNFNKGKRHLDAIFLHNSVSKEHRPFRKKLFEIFAVPPEEIEQARAETRQTLVDLANRAAAEKDQANPTMRLEAVFEIKPSGMHGHMFQHALSKVWEFKRMEPTMFIPLITAIIRQRQKNSQLYATQYGAELAYRLCVSSFERWIFDVNGNLTEKQSISPTLGPSVDF